MTPRAQCCKPCQNAKRGPEHPGWKGGRVVAPDGYAKVYAPDHPRANLGRYVKEHHLVMEGLLGRYLLPGESVHHRNGVRDDNWPENLELWVTGQPSGQRVEDVLAWAREVIARYDGLELPAYPQEVPKAA